MEYAVQTWQKAVIVSPRIGIYIFGHKKYFVTINKHLIINQCLVEVGARKTIQCLEGVEILLDIVNNINIRLRVKYG